MKNVETKIWGTPYPSPPGADCPKVVVRVEASCTRTRGSSMSMLMELSWASGGVVKRGGFRVLACADTGARTPLGVRQYFKL